MRKHPNKPVFSFFFILSLCISFTEMVMSQNTTIPVNIGVILDYDTTVGKIGLSCVNMSLSDFYASHSYYKTRLVLNTRDSKRDVVGAAAAALDLIKNVEVQAIIGPGNSMQANYVINLGHKAQVPIISFSASSPSLTSIRSSYFFRATQNDSSQVKAISAIIQAFGWREVVPIYVDNEFGEGVIPYLTDALQEIDTRVPYRSVISPSATDDQIVQELYKLMTMQTRVFIVHMLPSLGSQLFAKAKEVGMMGEGYVWIITNGITNLLSTMDPLAIESMQGVLGVKTYVPRTKELENFNVRWKRKFQQDNPTVADADLNIYGLWAYDAIEALAMAVEKIGTANFDFNKTNVSSGSTNLESFGVSQNGPKLLQALSNTKFKGLTGHYYFVNGQLQSSTFQIINVNDDNGGRRIGFWTPKNKLTRKLNSTNMSSTSKPNLRSIIWPGDSTSVPKGWDIPTNGKKLKILVPVKTGFNDLVKVTRDLITNTTIVTGYCKDVFDAVIKALPYVVTYEFIPFEKSDGTSAGNYNDLVYQVYLGKYDAVVGDTTIRANRSLYVDFTLPYTESEVSIIVPIKDNKMEKAWVFLKPLTWDLWVTSACSFVFIGFVIWVLEHRINEDFRGPPQYQVGTSFWFSFSTMVFSQRERVVSNLARFVLIIWCFVVLILTQSYTASLTSLLTVKQLQPTVTDIHELIKNGEIVGYQEGSFVLGLLKELGFKESKLKVYNSSEDCDELFRLGSANGGIAAAFFEVPSMKLFLGQHCSKYMKIKPTFKTNGFGFVFPRNSPLGSDVSRAILNLTEGDEMKKIEDAWFRKQTSCSDPSSLVSSNSLGLESFWGLFLIVGVASFSALIIYAATFLYAQREILMHLDPKASIWRKILVMLRIFYQRDLGSHTYKKSNMGDKSGIETSPNTNCPPSPSSYTNHTEFGELGTPSTEYDHPVISDQASQEIGLAIEHTNPNQERPITLEIVH